MKHQTIGILYTLAVLAAQPTLHRTPTESWGQRILRTLGLHSPLDDDIEQIERTFLDYQRAFLNDPNRVIDPSFIRRISDSVLSVFQQGNPRQKRRVFGFFQPVTTDSPSERLKLAIRSSSNLRPYYYVSMEDRKEIEMIIDFLISIDGDRRWIDKLVQRLAELDVLENTMRTRNTGDVFIDALEKQFREAFDAFTYGNPWKPIDVKKVTALTKRIRDSTSLKRVYELLLPSEGDTEAMRAFKRRATEPYIYGMMVERLLGEGEIELDVVRWMMGRLDAKYTWSAKEKDRLIQKYPFLSSRFMDPENILQTLSVASKDDDMLERLLEDSTVLDKILRLDFSSLPSKDAELLKTFLPLFFTATPKLLTSLFEKSSNPKKIVWILSALLMSEDAELSRKVTDALTSLRTTQGLLSVLDLISIVVDGHQDRFYDILLDHLPADYSSSRIFYDAVKKLFDEGMKVEEIPFRLATLIGRPIETGKEIHLLLAILLDSSNDTYRQLLQELLHLTIRDTSVRDWVLQLSAVRKDMRLKEAIERRMAPQWEREKLLSTFLDFLEEQSRQVGGRSFIDAVLRESVSASERLPFSLLFRDNDRSDLLERLKKLRQ